MSTYTSIAALTCVLVAGAAIAVGNAQPEKASMTPASPAAAPGKSGRAEIAGVSYYYEVRGNGAPLLLLHGGLGSSDMFAPMMSKLAESRQVRS